MTRPKRKALREALDKFLNVREELVHHLSYLDEHHIHVAELTRCLDWAGVQKPRTQLFTLPGTCWTCDAAWICAVNVDGNNLRPGLHQDVVLWHATRLALHLNPLLIAREFAIPPAGLAAEISGHLILERLGGPTR